MMGSCLEQAEIIIVISIIDLLSVTIQWQTSNDGIEQLLVTDLHKVPNQSI